MVLYKDILFIHALNIINLILRNAMKKFRWTHQYPSCLGQATLLLVTEEIASERWQLIDVHDVLYHGDSMAWVQCVSLSWAFLFHYNSFLVEMENKRGSKGKKLQGLLPRPACEAGSTGRVEMGRKEVYMYSLAPRRYV